MKALSYLSLLAATSLTALAAEPKADVAAAASMLDGKSSYAWVATTEIEGGQFTPAPVNGKTEKGGFTHISMKFGENEIDTFMKGTNFVTKTQDGWKNAAELAANPPGGGGGGGRGGFGRMFSNQRTPYGQVTNILAKAKEVKAADGKFTAEFSPEGAAELASLGGFRRPDAPAPKNASASAVFWIKDGLLQKYELKTKSTIVTQDGEDRTMARTTTVEIKDIGTAKVEVPAEAKSKF